MIGNLETFDLKLKPGCLGTVGPTILPNLLCLEVTNRKRVALTITRLEQYRETCPIQERDEAQLIRRRMTRLSIAGRGHFYLTARLRF